MDWSALEGTEPVFIPADDPEDPNPKGVVYLKNQVDGRVKAQFECWLSYNAELAKYRLRKLLNGNDYKEKCLNHEAAEAAGTYHWMGDAMLRAFTQIPGIVKMATLLAQAAEKENGRRIEERDIWDLVNSGADFAGAIRKVQENSKRNFHWPPTLQERQES